MIKIATLNELNKRFTLLVDVSRNNKTYVGRIYHEEDWLGYFLFKNNKKTIIIKEVNFYK